MAPKEELPEASRIICFCNNVPVAVVQQVVSQGAQSLDQIYEKCGAGVGPCGGTCRRNLQALLANTPSPLGVAKPETSWLPPLELVEAISLFNRRYYWETHEVLEDLWRVEHGHPRLFYQGIIQASAALYHVLNANPRGVLKLAQDAREKLVKYLPAYESIPLEKLVKTLEFYINEAREILGGAREGFDYDKLPVLNIKEGTSE